MPEPATSQANPTKNHGAGHEEALDTRPLASRSWTCARPDEYEIAKVKGVPLLLLSELSIVYRNLPNQQYYLHEAACGR